MNPIRGTRSHDGTVTASRLDRNPGLVGGAVIKGGTTTPVTRERSRISSPQQTEVTLPFGGKYTNTFTWVDGVPYDAQTLNQQVIYNVDSVMHSLVMLEQKFELDDIGTWVPISGLSFPVGANETWLITACVFYFATSGYWYSGLDLPTGGTLAGRTFHQNSSPIPEVGTWSDNASVEFTNGWYQNSETVAQGVLASETHDLIVSTTGGGTATWFVYTSVSGLKIEPGSTIMGVKL